MAILSPILFKRIGAALSCVLANLVTAAVIVALLYIALMEPADQASLALFASFLYIGFSLSVLSMISTSPMLDRIAPPEKKGFLQGINTAIYDFANAVGPFCLSLIGERKGASFMMWVCFGLSILAAASNLPLVFNHRVRDVKDDFDEDDATTPLTDETNIRERLNNAEHVPLSDVFEVNRLRLERGEPLLRSSIGIYSREDVDQMQSLWRDDLVFLRSVVEERICDLRDIPGEKEKFVQYLNATRPSREDSREKSREVGTWVTDYLSDNGYFAATEDFQVFKATFVRAFPRLSKGDQLTVDMVEDHLLNLDRALNRIIELDQRPAWWRQAFEKKGLKYKIA